MHQITERNWLTHAWYPVQLQKIGFPDIFLLAVRCGLKVQDLARALLSADFRMLSDGPVSQVISCGGWGGGRGVVSFISAVLPAFQPSVFM